MSAKTRVSKSLCTSCLFAILLMLGLTPLGYGYIYLDENFEDAQAFTDIANPIKDNKIPGADPAVTQGIRIRTGSSADYESKPDWLMTNTGTVVNSRFFTGRQSLKLQNGEIVSTPRGGAKFAKPTAAWYRVVQFAVSVDENVHSLPAGTKIGHFKWDWSFDATGHAHNPDATVDATYELDFVTNGSQVDIVLGGSGATVASLTGAMGPQSWAMVTIIANTRAMEDPDNEMSWICYRRSSDEYIGPQPRAIDAADPAKNLWATLSGGIYVFADSNMPAIYSIGTDIDPRFGHVNNGLVDTMDMGWEIAAENDGTLYLDEMLWTAQCYGVIGDDGDYTYENDAAVRINPFDAESTEQGGVAAAAKSWNLYE